MGQFYLKGWVGKDWWLIVPQWPVPTLLLCPHWNLWAPSSGCCLNIAVAREVSGFRVGRWWVTHIQCGDWAFPCMIGCHTPHGNQSPGGHQDFSKRQRGDPNRTRALESENLKFQFWLWYLLFWWFQQITFPSLSFLALAMGRINLPQRTVGSVRHACCLWWDRTVLLTGAPVWFYDALLYFDFQHSP